MSQAAFKAARDFLLAQRGDYATAYRDFRWPALDHFNWALDWFDAELAQGAHGARTALRIVGDGAAERSFAELSAASNRVANGLRALGVKRGDRILLMLGNVVPLWEVMLAAMKLGAVVIPATTLLAGDDLKDPFDKGPRALRGGQCRRCTQIRRDGGGCDAHRGRPSAGGLDRL